MTFRLRRTAIVAATALVSLVVTGSAAHAAPSGPTAVITDVKTQPGIVQYLFSVKGLSPDQHLDPNTVVVTAGSSTLSATGAIPDATSTSGPTKTPLREVILTLDTSGSMAGDGIAAARTAAIAYAKSLPADVKIGVVAFSDAPHVLLQPTADRSKVTGAINTVRAAGNTALFDAVVTAAGLLHGLPSDSVRRLVILSDGDDTTSSHSLANATAALKSDDITADAVAFRIPGDPTVLRQITSQSGGKVIAASSAGALTGAFAAVVESFDQQVLVTIQVTKDNADTTQTLVTSLNAGNTSLSATTTVNFPDALSGAKPTQGLVVSSPKGKTSTALLWGVTGLVFLAFLVAALTALWIPASQRDAARKDARLAEVNRYQLIGAMGARQADQQAVPNEGQFAKAASSLVDQTLRARGTRDRIVDELSRAGLRMKPEEWVIFQATSVVVLGAVIALLIHSILGLVIGGVFAYLASRVFMNTKISKRSAAFMDQLPDTLQLIAGSLRSGFSLNQALVGVVREGSEPTASELSRALTEARIGAELEDALDDVAKRMRCPDLHWVVMAVRISREVGGNLAEVLQNTVGTMRERAQLRGQVRVLSAEGRISARILIGLPFLLAGYMLIFKKGYLSPLIHTGAGVAILIVGIVLLVLGAFWISRLVKIEV